MNQAGMASYLRSFARTRGEIYVWISSMGLTVGLVMIVFLLGIILSNGLTVFWPKPIAAFQLIADSSAKIGNADWIEGEIVKKQKKQIHDASESDLHAAPHALSQSFDEYQLFVANRDVYGFSFKYVDADQVRAISYPKDALLIERLENGKAIGSAVSLMGPEGRIMPAGDPGFQKLFSELVEGARVRRQEIQNIEKAKIGTISDAMRGLSLEERGLERTGKANADAKKKIADRLAVLQSEYEVLASQAKQLRTEQSQWQFTYRIASGQERTLSLGNIVHYSYPNQLSFLGKLAAFARNFWYFVSENPREANTEGGIFPAIFGTAVMTVLMSIAVMPFGVVAAIYLREYAVQGWFVRVVRISVNNLAGVPSIVFGVFGLGFFVYFLGGTMDRIFFPDALPTPTFGTGGVLWAALTLALMTVPVVVVATEEALASVPRGVREGSLACGASKWQTMQRIVLPAAAPGILTGLILAMARGAGEVAPLMLVGVVKLAPALPIDSSFPFIHLDRKFMHLGFHIYDLGFQSPDSEAAKPMVFATTLLLILLVVILNFAAILIRERLRKKYSTGNF